MATRKQAITAVREAGAELYTNRASIMLDCPQGQRFKLTGEHFRDYDRDTFGPVSDIYTSIVEMCDNGLEPCDDADCDYCTEPPVDVCSLYRAQRIA